MLAGAFTPSEALRRDERAEPTSSSSSPPRSGGPGYLKALRDPLPGIPFIAVGGVGLDDVAAYLGAGAIAVGARRPAVRRCRLRRRASSRCGSGPAPSCQAAASGIRRRDRRRGAAAVDLLTFGESMVSFRSAGPLSMGGALTMHVAGAEINVAVGLARLGHAAAWAGVVGGDPYGEFVLRAAARRGGRTCTHAGDDARRPGLMFLEQRTADVTRVDYRRAGSAGSTLCTDDLRAAVADAASCSHLTGITPALSEEAAAAVE